MNPHRAADGSLSTIARKGKSLFEGKAGCATCHRGQHFTFQGTFDVGLGSPQDAYPEYNPPVLRGLYARRRFLHDGRARSLQEVLREHHQPEAVAGEPLEDTELEAILAYLNSL